MKVCFAVLSTLLLVGLSLQSTIKREKRSDHACLAGWEDCTSNDQCCSGLCTGSGMCSEPEEEGAKEETKEVVEETIEIPDEPEGGDEGGEGGSCGIGWDDCTEDAQCCSARGCNKDMGACYD